MPFRIISLNVLIILIANIFNSPLKRVTHHTRSATLCCVTERTKRFGVSKVFICLFKKKKKSNTFIQQLFSTLIIRISFLNTKNITQTMNGAASEVSIEYLMLNCQIFLHLDYRCCYLALTHI